MYMYIIIIVVNVLIPHIQEVLMNIRVPKSAKGYKAVAETFGQRYITTVHVHVHVHVLL